MPQIINTNVASLNAQRNLDSSQASANKALQRLSSGLRINSAKDDAAGLAISNRLTSQINGINQAIRNANDGISVAQVAEGALGETTNILQRMRELSIQSANASNGSEERAALQAEVAELISEVDRIAGSTSFGSTKLLDGNYTAQQFQVGAQRGETISVSIAGASSTDIGVTAVTFAGFNSDNVGTAAGTPVTGKSTQTLTFAVNDTTTQIAVDGTTSAEDLAAEVNSNVDGLNAKASTTARLVFGGAPDSAADVFSFEFTANGETNSISVTGETTAAGVQSAITSAINDLGLDGVTATLSGGNIDITDANGGNMTFDTFADSVTGGTTSTLEVDSVDAAGVAAGNAQAITGDGTIVFGDIEFSTNTPDASFALSSTDGSGGITGSTTPGAGAGTAALDTTRQVADVDISTVSGANEALDILDAALSSVDSQRADLGAVQNRLESVISNLANVSENSAAARSRIRDADFAQETAALSKSQILQQAGISVLAQANASTQNVLALLQ